MVRIKRIMEDVTLGDNSVTNCSIYGGEQGNLPLITISNTAMKIQNCVIIANSNIDENIESKIRHLIFRNHPKKKRQRLRFSNYIKNRSK